MKQGLIEVYCGDGKGKTTAALGLILRASGRGFKGYPVPVLEGLGDGGIENAAALTGGGSVPGAGHH
jgi:cob(I)alamin adenosyltransferase